MDAIHISKHNANESCGAAYLGRYGSDGLSIIHLFEPSSRFISDLHAPSSDVDDDEEEGAGVPVTLCRKDEEPEEEAMKAT